NPGYATGSLQGLSYPITGGARPSYCGPSEFHISCVDDSPELTIMSLRRPKCFLRLSYPFETLLGSDPRIQTQAHSSGCWNKKTPTSVNCKIETTVLILKTAAAKLGANRSLFQEAIMEGFNVNYTNPYDNECSKWLDVKSCGFDSHSSRPVCFCGDRVCDILGSYGGYGTVYRGKLPDGLLVAVKVLSESKGNGEDFINEVASIGRTSHVNIVTLCGFCYERNKRALIYEFMPNESLDNFIRKQGSEMANSRLEWKKLSEIAVGIARGLEYLHQFCPKVADFGLAKLCKKKERIVSMLGTRGTAGYITPEVFSWNFGGVSHKCDVYSYGMLVLEMVGARKNLDSAVSHTSEMFPHYVYKDLELDKDDNVFGATTEGEKEIARKMVLTSLWCIQTNPDDRPSMSKVVEMLEGPLHSLQIAPKPLLVSPTIAAEDSMTTSQPPETEDSITTSKPLRVSLRYIGI
ncbi:hypothetical protein PRUPE_3G145900, partial [Prunus persica]